MLLMTFLVPTVIRRAAENNRFLAAANHAGGCRYGIKLSEQHNNHIYNDAPKSARYRHRYDAGNGSARKRLHDS
jgi:hypothetical protein